MAGQRTSPVFEIVGLAEVVANLNDAVKRMGPAGSDGLRKVAYQVINEAKSFCPVDTGRLRASLGGGPDGVAADGVLDDSNLRGPAVIVGTHVDYAAYVEFGTTNHGAAQPYLRPALERVRAEMMGEVRDVIRHDIPELH